jgi:hypothetical protein
VTEGARGLLPVDGKEVIMKRLLVSCSLLALLAGSIIVPAGASGGTHRHLQPGETANLREQVPVNFVFVGYEEQDVAQSGFLAGLPDKYRPVVRSRLFYGLVEYLGINYTYDYDVLYADAEFEDQFFGELSRLATPAPRTQYQNDYNAQDNNVLNVGRNHFIDAPSVETWLRDNAPESVDTSENTIFFVNWYGRDDFKFHVYTKTNEPDPDTGYNFGELRESRKIISWGGTSPDDEENGYSGDEQRIWFYDLSAGPESWTDNWNVDNPDLDDNGEVDYRMPPIWEYTEGGFRSPSALTKDLGLVARYVGLDLLFTTSPLYPPAITPPSLPGQVNLDTNTYEGWPGTNASEKYITDRLFVDEVSELQPLTDFSYDKQDLPLTGEARRCYVLWIQDSSCYPRLGYPAFANLFLYNAITAARWEDGPPTADYEAGLFNYATVDRLAPAGLLGYADDNYVDGTQTFVFSFVSPAIANEFGYGLTTTMIHEVGHHAAMSHPHDGFDYEAGVDFEPVDAYYFAWSGDQTNSIMSYIDLNWDFSQFDLDNMNRFMAATYITNANAIAATILEDPDAADVADELAAADASIGRAKQAFKDHDYPTAAGEAKAAYDTVAAAGEQVGVGVRGSKAGRLVSAKRFSSEERDPMHSAFKDRIFNHRARR